MNNTKVFHATILNLHQPSGNLEGLLDQGSWEPKEILFALDRIPRAVKGYEDIARVHLSLSGTLLETLSNPTFQERVYGIVKCGDLLYNLRNPALNILATAYYHPVLPLIPEADRKEHIVRWLGIGHHLFDYQQFCGFWPPEMAFSMELIPLLKRAGFKYVVVDSENVVAKTPMSWHELRYRPHIARFGNEEIVVIVRDRDLSNAQEGGMEPEWFVNEVTERTRHCDFPALVTTCTDGDNGGWFRNVKWESNYWGAFYQPLMQISREANLTFKPTFIDEYLHNFGAYGEVIVRSGAWNTGDHSGIGFVQWTGSFAQKEALKRLQYVSRELHDLRWTEAKKGCPDPGYAVKLEQAMWRLLRAETSCNFYWGEAWVQRCHDDLDQAYRCLGI